ncbi:YggN family protein [Pseudoalteromonas ostreae]|uniref:YggN family protein n=1 Tax=Pseudoalteromonas ostreae TaxID=2774154 RepID=UPI001B372013|nr:YggN family protein [Pseudoalteromonas ostreae]
MKKLLLISALFIATGAMAHNDNETNISFSGDTCAVEFKNDVRIKPNELEIYTADNHTMTFINNGELMIDGQTLVLNSQQHQALSNYSDSLRSQLPEVANIALEGVKIAGVAIEEVANAFNIDGLDSINELMADIQVEVQNTFYQQGAFVLGQQSFNQFGENFESQFDEQIESAVQAAMMQSMGSILMAVGSELMGSGGDMQTFEQRMVNMGAEIEAKVEQQANELEKRADVLCGNFSTIADQEQQLVKLVPELKDYQLFSYKQNN